MREEKERRKTEDLKVKHVRPHLASCLVLSNQKKKKKKKDQFRSFRFRSSLSSFNIFLRTLFCVSSSPYCISQMTLFNGSSKRIQQQLNGLFSGRDQILFLFLSYFCLCVLRYFNILRLCPLIFKSLSMCLFSVFHSLCL